MKRHGMHVVVLEEGNMLPGTWKVDEDGSQRLSQLHVRPDEDSLMQPRSHHCAVVLQMLV